MVEIRDTSKDYDDLVGYRAKELIPIDLSNFIDEPSPEYKPVIKSKPIDPDFPEEWQNLFVNFNNEQDYIKFMQLIDEAPNPKTSTVIYSKVKNKGILDFME